MKSLGICVKHGEDFYVAYSPEREDPGNADFRTSSIPKLVGAANDSALLLSCEFYKIFIDNVISVSSMEIAEAAKIAENTFRAVNIAFVNELKVIFDRMGILLSLQIMIILITKRSQNVENSFSIRGMRCKSVAYQTYQKPCSYDTKTENPSFFRRHTPPLTSACKAMP